MICSLECMDDDGVEWVCTLQAGHEGKHQARRFDDHCYHEWPNDAARGLPPISETREEKPLFKSDDEMLISLTGSAKEVALKNPDGSTWTPSAPATPAPAGDGPHPMDDAPETRAQAEWMDSERIWVVNMGYCAEMERQRNASRREVAEIARERDEAVARARRVAEEHYQEISAQLTKVTEQLQAAVAERDMLRLELQTQTTRTIAVTRDAVALRLQANDPDQIQELMDSYVLVVGSHELRELRVELSALRAKAVEALYNFGEHASWCRSHFVTECDCGYSEALTALRGDNAGGEK